MQSEPILRAVTAAVEVGCIIVKHRSTGRFLAPAGRRLQMHELACNRRRARGKSRIFDVAQTVLPLLTFRSIGGCPAIRGLGAPSHRRELLPKGVPYPQVDFEFVAKQGYAKNVLQRDTQALHTLEKAKVHLQQRLSERPAAAACHVPRAGSWKSRWGPAC